MHGRFSLNQTGWTKQNSNLQEVRWQHTFKSGLRAEKEKVIVQWTYIYSDT